MRRLLLFLLTTRLVALAMIGLVASLYSPGTFAWCSISGGQYS